MAEIKSEGGRMSAAQTNWYADLMLVQDAAPGVVAVRSWRPSDQAAIDATLAR